MSTNVHPIPGSGRILARPERDAIEHRLARYRPEIQLRVRSLAARHAWFADLALSFPALLFALAAPRKGVDAHAAAGLVMNGASLARVALAVRVPMWMRAFPPEAFAAPLPPLPDGPEFRRRIANHLPANRRWAPRWIEMVSHAARWGNDDIALWFAREAPLRKPKKTRYRIQGRDHRNLVCLWAWFSGQGHECAGARIATPWRPELQWKAAQEAALFWSDALALRLYLGEGGVDDVWLEEGEVDGYVFVALRSAQAVEAEAQAMKHCVGSYGSSIAGNDYRLFSVRKDGERIATLALQRGDPEGPFPTIAELAGEQSESVGVDVWRAARRWLHAQDANAVGARMDFKDANFDPRAWRAFWRPYWLAKRAIPSWLPLAPNGAAFRAL